MEAKQVIVDGMHTHYLETGSGPVILYLHGWGSQKEHFTDLMNELAKSGNCHIALDLPGFGQTSPPTDSWGVGQYAHFTQQFLEKVAVQPSVLVGHSLGGRIIIKGVAEGIISTPKKQIFLAAAGSAKRKTARNALFMVLAKIGKVVFAVPPLSFFAASLRTKLYQAAGSTDYLHSGQMKDTFLKVLSENLLETAKELTPQTLLIWGDNDTETPLAEGELLSKVIPEAELVVIPNVGHYPHHEALQKVAARIKLFLS